MILVKSLDGSSSKEERISSRAYRGEEVYPVYYDIHGSFRKTTRFILVFFSLFPLSLFCPKHSIGSQRKSKHYFYTLLICSE